MKRKADAARAEVAFWGTRGSISTPGRATEKYGGNTPCVCVKAGDTTLILDAGTGIRNLGLELLGKRPTRPLRLHLFLSHTHWDHIQGLPFFAPAYTPGTRLNIYGGPKKRGILKAILAGQMDLNYFPVPMSELAAELTITELTRRKLRISPFGIQWQEQHRHPGGSVRYRLSLGRRRIVYASDIELDTLCPPRTRTDRALLREYGRFIRDADLLIADGQYSTSEYRAHRSWGHSSFPQVAALAARFNVRRLALFHHDPQHSDATLDRWARELRRQRTAGQTEVFWAREGMTLTI